MIPTSRPRYVHNGSRLPVSDFDGKNEGQKHVATRRTRQSRGIIFLPQMFLPVFFRIAVS